MSNCDFTFGHLREVYLLAQAQGYQIITLAEWFNKDFDPRGKVLINRIDVDYRIDRMVEFARIFQELCISASIFFRVHSPRYNLLSFDSINLVKALADAGHDVGLHSEILDFEAICGADPSQAVFDEVELFKNLIGVDVVGIASHDDHTPSNNLDFWKEHSPEEFGLLYEAYDNDLWNRSRYVSDSGLIKWRCYDRGLLMDEDSRCPCAHIKEGVDVLYLLTHPDNHFTKFYGEFVPALTDGRS